MSFFRLIDIALRLNNSERIDSLYDSLNHLNKNFVIVKTMTDLAGSYTEHDRLNRSKMVLDKLMRTNPQYDEAYYEYARFLTRNRNLKNALTAVSNAIILNNKNGKAFNLLGEILFVSDDIPNNKALAQEQFENAIKLSPDYYKPYANLGHIYFYYK